MRDQQLLRTNVTRLCASLIILFAALSVWMLYWQVISAPKLRADEYNPRAKERMKLTEPGRILTRDGQVILQGIQGSDGWELDYPGGDIFCHLTGYNAKTGLQASLSDALYAQGDYEDPWVNLLRGRATGRDIHLTLNARAQTLAAQALLGSQGAVVAMDPRNGAILVLTSSPGFDPIGIMTSKDEFNLFQNNPGAPELNRPIQGLYPPGSVLKILTAAAALDAGVARATDEFNCKGTERIGGSQIKCRRTRGHGRITLTEGLTDSCNIVFAELANRLGPDKFREYVNKFHLLDRPELGLPASTGRMAPMTGEDAEAQIAEAGFGQGATLITPLSIACMTAAIANDGVIPRPWLLESITPLQGGKALYTNKPETLGQACGADAARLVAGMMVETVERGTGRGAYIRGIAVGGKTGSAETSSGSPHAWFTAFAPAGNPSVVVTVIIENGGSGGEVAAPIVRDIIEELLKDTK